METRRRPQRRLLHAHGSAATFALSRPESVETGNAAIHDCNAIQLVSRSRTRDPGPQRAGAISACRHRHAVLVGRPGARTHVRNRVHIRVMPHECRTATDESVRGLGVECSPGEEDRARHQQRYSRRSHCCHVSAIGIQENRIDLRQRSGD